MLATACLVLASKFYELDEILILTYDIRKKFGKTFIAQSDFDRAEL
jgi:hypothetical protein